MYLKDLHLTSGSVPMLISSGSDVDNWNFEMPPPLRFLKTIKDRDLKLTPLIKRREINLLLLSYLSCDVT